RVRALLLSIAVAAPVANGRLSADRPVDGWPGWRGGTAEGRVPGPLPTTWSDESGVRWKTFIPGRGHSSPIVFGDRVYVTTADTTVSGTLMKRSLQWIMLVLALCLIQWSVQLAVMQCTSK